MSSTSPAAKYRGTKVDTILDLDFAEKDVIVLRGYDQGTFASAPGLVVFDGGRSANVDLLADLRHLVAGSADVTSRSGGGGTEVLRIVQDGGRVHEESACDGLRPRPPWGRSARGAPTRP